MMDVRRFEGGLLGLAVGDALGMQVEGSSDPGYIRDYGDARPDSVNAGLKAGQYTDDTIQMLILTESILKSHGFDIEVFVSSLIEWGKEIMINIERARGIGPTSLEAITNLLDGVDWMRSGGFGPTCGSAMRVAPIGLLYHRNFDLIAEIAACSSIPTHRSPESIAGAVSVAVAVGGVTSGLEIETSIIKSADYAEKHSKILAEKIRLAVSLRNEPPAEAFSKIGRSVLAAEAVPAAMYAALSGESFEDALLIAVNHGGDTDSIGAMTGAIKGAYHTIDGIPPKWLIKLEDCEEIRSSAKRLYALCESGF
ncbi:MAG: ADP-ribosylglycohydrolase family protein [Candidatus Syntrophoarchaeum sp. WYZ-LMO15]|nr:MAG: ADP-ribosylglycohydrolase family protein [Candidatus Syntrophoarchaeum sp. WYZ-LMO15]